MAEPLQSTESTQDRCYPKFRENIWHFAKNAKPDDVTVLITSKGQYELPASYTSTFIKIRPYCTGHHSVDSIARKTGVSTEEIMRFVEGFRDIDLAYPEDGSFVPPNMKEIRESLVTIVTLWAHELHSGYVASELLGGRLSKSILVGWMIEMYHYVKDFPMALQHGADNATGELRKVLDRYAREEMGHEGFVLRSLANMGMSETEVKTSVPLISTRAIGLLLRELVELEPAAALLAAALLEAADFDEDNIKKYQQELSRYYGISENALDPHFEHQKIDYELGHQRLLEDNINFIEFSDLQHLDDVLNKLHDLKHAFELQSLEVKAYYGEPLNGRYFPRQAMTYQAI